MIIIFIKIKAMAIFIFTKCHLSRAALKYSDSLKAYIFLFV